MANVLKNVSKSFRSETTTMSIQIIIGEGIEIEVLRIKFVFVFTNIFSYILWSHKYLSYVAILNLLNTYVNMWQRFRILLISIPDLYDEVLQF